KDPLHQAVVPRSADVVHDLVVAAFLERPPDAPADVGQGLRPRDAGPAALAAPADALQGIEDPVRIVDLVQRRGTLGAVTPAAGELFASATTASGMRIPQARLPQ